jgi:hypothetical protein
MKPYLRKVHIDGKAYVYDGFSTSNSTGLVFWAGKTKYRMPLSEICKTEFILPIPSDTKELIKLFLKGTLTAEKIHQS